MSEIAYLEPWLDKRGVAEFFAVGVRWVEYRMEESRATADPIPHAIIAGRVKFRASEVERWLERNGHIERKGAA